MSFDSASVIRASSERRWEKYELENDIAILSIKNAVLEDTLKRHVETMSPVELSHRFDPVTMKVKWRISVALAQETLIALGGKIEGNFYTPPQAEALVA